MSQHYDDTIEKMDDQKFREYATREQAKLDAFVRRLPPMVVTLQELERLSEYSASYPTGTTPGKIWKAELNAYDRAFHRGGGKTRWIIRQYDPDCPPEAKEIHILQFRPVIRVKALSHICVDKQQQRTFLLDQAYFISGLNPFEHSTHHARETARDMGYQLPTIRELYEDS